VAQRALPRGCVGFLFVATKGCSEPAAPPNSSAIHSGRGTTPYAPSQCCTARDRAVATRELRGGHAGTTRWPRGNYAVATRPPRGGHAATTPVTTAAAEQPTVVRGQPPIELQRSHGCNTKKSRQHRSLHIYLYPHLCRVHGHGRARTWAIAEAFIACGQNMSRTPSRAKYVSCGSISVHLPKAPHHCVGMRVLGGSSRTLRGTRA
jgi:hypothetical protein